MSAQYDASVALDRKLTEDETRELKISLMPYFHATGDNEASPEDINDLLDYAFAMVNNQKTVEYVIQELVGMEMEFCNAAVAEKVGAELSGFLKKAKGEVETSQGSKIASLKSTSSEKGNALTMSGALGASREGGRSNNNKPKAEKGGKVDNKKRDDRRGGDRKGRGERNDHRGRGRSTHKEAFDRLSNGGRRGRDNDRRRRDEDRRGGRGGRGGGRFGGRGDRGNRRSRDEYEDDKKGEGNNDFEPMRDGGRGRGRGRGGEGRGAKRARYDDHFDEGYDNGGYYDEGYGYDDGYGYGGYHGYGGRGRGFRGGRGRGRFGGRGRGRGRGHGRGGPPQTEGGEGAEGGKEDALNASDAANHPSPMVQATYSGGRYGGRGRFGRGRGGRGRGGGRAHVVSMIQSKTWVRKKPEDAAADAATPAE